MVTTFYNYRYEWAIGIIQEKNKRGKNDHIDIFFSYSIINLYILRKKKKKEKWWTPNLTIIITSKQKESIGERNRRKGSVQQRRRILK